MKSDVASPSRAASSSILAAILLIAGLVAAPARAQTSGVNATHDPSRIVASDGKFYFCSTGGSCASSANGLAWAATGLRIAVPSWSTTYTPGGNQGIWAPDIIFYAGKYFIYYSFCGVPAADAPCVIGLYTTPTLDATSSRYKLTDEGMVVNNPMNDATYQFSTIDPGPIVDAAGNLWASWGSGYGKDQTLTQLWVTRLTTTGLPLGTDASYRPPTVLGHALEPGRREGPYLHYRNGYYYLFWNEGRCCSGTASDYTIWVARSQGSITGPYSGTKVFFAGSGTIHGPGHIGIYSACGVERFSYHYYPTASSVLGENDLSWSGDDWPLAGAVSTTPLVPCDPTGGGGSGGSGGSNGSPAGGRGGSAGGAGARGGSGGASAGTGGANPGGAAGTAGRTNGGGAPGGGGAGGTGAGAGQSGDGGTPSGMTGGAAGISAPGSGGGAGEGGSPSDHDAGTNDGTSAGCACSALPGRSGPEFLLLLAFVLAVRRLRVPPR